MGIPTEWDDGNKVGCEAFRRLKEFQIIHDTIDEKRWPKRVHYSIIGDKPWKMPVTLITMED